jgi:hypothetical protein
MTADRRATRLFATLLASATLAGCLDFIEPDIPQAGAPATFQVTVVIGADGLATLSGEFHPGYDGVGLLRTVPDEAARIFGRVLEPVERLEDGRRRYLDARTVTPTEALGPVTVEPPAVTGTTSPAPASWVGIRGLGPDTLTLDPGEDLVLELEVAEGGTATVRQWFLDLAGRTGSVRLSADGSPPARLVVPAVWVPEPRADGTVLVNLNYVQSELRVGPTGDYVFSGSLHIRVRWVVVAGPHP